MVNNFLNSQWLTVSTEHCLFYIFYNLYMFRVINFIHPSRVKCLHVICEACMIANPLIAPDKISKFWACSQKAQGVSHYPTVGSQCKTYWSLIRNQVFVPYACWAYYLCYIWIIILYVYIKFRYTLDKSDSNQQDQSISWVWAHMNV